MKKRVAILAAAFAAVAAAVLLGGCAPESELAGLPIPNVLPETRITGEPPNVVDAGFQVRFYWTGYDPDGKIRGYQWKLSTNSTDGISVHDTLTVDPATGNILHPWHFTTRSDSLFVVTADLGDFPGDSELPPTNRRAYQVHTLFVRTVDEEGGVDPTPAFISFTSTTLLPTIKVDRPTKLRGTSLGGAPRTVSIGYIGTDEDFELNAPTKVRYLWKPAIGPNGLLIKDYAFMRLDPTILPFLASFSDSAWGPWVEYGKTPDRRMIVYKDQADRMTDPAGTHDAVYVFAIQAQDTAGARNVDQTLGENVLLVQIDRALRPELVVAEENLGMVRVTGTYQVYQRDIAQGQVMKFSWSANANLYGGQVVAYRYGWDLKDPEDENDTGWAVMPGNTTSHRSTAPVSFDADIHTLTVQCEDNSGELSRVTIVLTVVPVPPPQGRRDLLLVDAVPDEGNNSWLTDPTQGPVRPMDEDQYRDEFWEEVLTSAGGVDDFDPGIDIIDGQEDSQALNYRAVVGYKALLWTTRPHALSWTQLNFQPKTTGAQYVWLVPYQEMVGNLFLVGERAASCFVEAQPRGFNLWMLPWIFTAPDISSCYTNGTCYGTGFGVETLPDGSEIDLGPQRYPYRALGIALLDHFVPDYAYGITVQQGARRSACVGMKAIKLDPAFRDAYMPEGSPFPATILTEPTIDWEDRRTDKDINLQNYFWSREEFYELNVGSDRSTLVEPTTCGSRVCIDPMFRAYTRFDFVNDEQAALGNTAWPFDTVTPPGGTPTTRFSPTDRSVLNSVCGLIALRWSEDPLVQEPYVRIRDVPVGFISHRLETNKPTPKGDVVWGFDPHRFDHDQIKRAIRWVLGEHFGLTMSPGS